MPDTIAEKIFLNAVESIRIGMEDLRRDTFGRLTSAIRNFSAGVQLLCKARLAEVDESALYPPKKESKGRRRTLYLKELQDAFEGKSLDVGEINWKRMADLSRLRNDFEHLFPTGSISDLRVAVKTKMTGCLPTVNYLIQEVFQEDPVEIFGLEIWADLLAADEVHNQERVRQKAEFEKYYGVLPIFIYDHIISDFMCEKCKCDIAMPISSTRGDDFMYLTYKCHQCGQTYTHDALINVLREEIENKYFHQIDYSPGDYYEEVFVPCPSCGVTAYDFENHQCLYCGDETKFVCACGNEISREDMAMFDFQEDHLCSDCRHLQDLISKDD